MTGVVFKRKSDSEMATDFFGGSGAVDIEARSKTGEPVAVQGRRVSQALMGARGLLLSTVIALGSIGATGTAAAAEQGLVPLNEQQINAMITDTIGTSMPFVTTAKAQADISGPSAVLLKQDDGRAVCSVSLDKLDTISWLLAKGVEVASVERMREFTVRHEAAHCMFFSRLGVPEAGAISGPSESMRGLRIGSSDIVAGAQYDLIDQLGKAAERKTGVSAVGESLLLQMLSEGYADAYAVLSIAKKHLGTAATPEEAKEGMKAFAEHIDDVHGARSSLAIADPTHDSSELIAHIKALVQTKGQSAEGLKELREGVLSQANMDVTALQWATGSVLHRSDHLSKTTLKDVLEKLPDQLSDLPPDTEQPIKDLVSAKPRALAAIASGADLGLKPEDFSGGARVLADRAFRSFKTLSDSPAPQLEPVMNGPQSAAQPDALHTKLHAPGAMVGRMFGSSMLGGHAHHHDENRCKHTAMRMR